MHPDTTRTGPLRRARGRTTRAAVVASAATALVLGAVAPASAHVTVTASTTAAGSTSVLEFAFSHGCDGSPTTAVTVRIPEGVNSAAPTRSPLWDVETTTETLDPPVTDSHGAEIAERVASVTWTTDDPVPDGVRDTLALSVPLPDAEGETLAFPVIQTCEGGETAWIDVAADPEDAEGLDSPAPTVTLTAADESDGHSHGAAGEEDHDAAEDTALASAASVSDDTDGGSSTPVVSWIALVVAIIGAALGAAALVTQRRRA